MTDDRRAAMQAARTPLQEPHESDGHGSRDHPRIACHVLTTIGADAFAERAWAEL
jgi:hypothetical protein